MQNLSTSPHLWLCTRAACGGPVRRGVGRWGSSCRGRRTRGARWRSRGTSRPARQSWSRVWRGPGGRSRRSGGPSPYGWVVLPDLLRSRKVGVQAASRRLSTTLCCRCPTSAAGRTPGLNWSNRRDQEGRPAPSWSTCYWCRRFRFPDSPAPSWRGRRSPPGRSPSRSRLAPS